MVAESEWCSCSDETTSGHLSLAPVANVYVHGKCLKPSFLVWQAFEDYCFECGGSFSSPVSTECPEHNGLTWAELAQQYRNFLELRDAHFYMVNG